MSDTWLILIPETPTDVPEADRQLQALEHFRQLAPVADELAFKVSDSI